MSAHLAKNTDHLFHDINLTPDQLSSNELVEEAFNLSLPYGTLKMQQWYFDGIRIKHTKNNYANHFLFEKKNEMNVVGLEFNLKGNHIIHQGDKIFYVSDRQHNIVYSPGAHNTFENFNLETETFSIHFRPDVFLRIVEDGNDSLKRFAEKMLKTCPVVISPTSLIINTELQKAINEILGSKYSGGLKKLFLLSKSIEILVLQAEAFDKLGKSEVSPDKKPADKEKILFAKEYLEKHMDSPPSLSELSRIAGINEYKLKRGFKEVYNTTVFGYLSDYRLGNAWQQLMGQEKTASEIAYELGYSSRNTLIMLLRKNLV